MVDRLTSDEKLVVRGKRPDGSRRILTPRSYYASIAERVEVFSGQVNGSAYADGQTLGYYRADYDNESGDYADVLIGMTIDFGTTPGARDIGTSRIRQDGSAIAVEFAETPPSLLPIVDNCYFSVKREFRPFLVMPRGVGASINGASYTNSITMYVDYDNLYVDDNENFVPKANITRSATGKPYAPKPAGWVDDFHTVSAQAYRTVTLSAAFSLTLTTGAAIIAWHWDVGDGTIVSGTDSSETISVRFPVGFRCIRLTVDDSAARFGSMYYPIWVHDADNPPLSRFHIARDWTGDWHEHELEFFAQDVSEVTIPAGTAICCWEDDPFWGQPIPDAYRDQTLGWCKEDTTLFRKTDPRTTLIVTGMGEWFNRFRSIPQRISDTNAAATSWFNMEDISLDRLAYYLYKNFCTGALIGNFILSGVDDTLKSLDLTGQSLLGQIQYAVQGYYGRARFDSLNQLILKRGRHYMDDAEKAVDSAVDDLTPADHAFSNPVKINRRYYHVVASLLGAGASFDGATTSTIYNARAPGRTPAESNSEQDAPGQNLPSSDPQDALNRLTAAHFKVLNNERDSVAYDLLPNLDIFEPAWGEPLTVTETDSDSGLELDQDEFLVKEVSISYEDGLSGMGKRISLTLEGVVSATADDAQVVVVVPDETDPIDSLPPVDILPVPILPDPIPDWTGALPLRVLSFAWESPDVWMTDTMDTSGVLNWNDRSNALSNAYFRWAYSNPFAYGSCFATGDAGIEMCPDIVAGSNFSLIRSNLDIWGSAAYAAHKIAGSHMTPGYGFAASGSNAFAYTSDGWLTSSLTAANGGSIVPDDGDPHVWLYDVALCPHNAGHLIAFVEDVAAPSTWYSVYRTTDGGANWSEVHHHFASRTAYSRWWIDIPYNRIDGSANLDDADIEYSVRVSGDSHNGSVDTLYYFRGFAGDNVLIATATPGGQSTAGTQSIRPMTYFTHDASYSYWMQGDHLLHTENNYTAESDLGDQGVVGWNWNGWPKNPDAAIGWLPVSGGLALVFDGLTVLSANMPAGVTSLAYAEYMLVGTQ